MSDPFAKETSYFEKLAKLLRWGDLPAPDIEMVLSQNSLGQRYERHMNPVTLETGPDITALHSEGQAGS